LQDAPPEQASYNTPPLGGPYALLDWLVTPLPSLEEGLDFRSDCAKGSMNQ